MPSSILINGKKTYAAGVYGSPDFSELSGKSVSRGVLAIVGDFQDLECKVLYVFTNASAVRDMFPNNLLLQDLAKCAFKPSFDSKVPQGCAVLIFCNVTPNTQASKTFKDVDSVNNIQLLSKQWGAPGNQLFYKVANNAVDHKGLDITLAAPGMPVELYKNVQSGSLADVYYDGADLTATTVAFDTDKWTWAWSIVGANLPGAAPPNNKQVLNPTAITIQGKLTAVLSVAPGGGVTVTVTVECITSLGVSKTLTLLFPAGQAGPLVLQDTGVDALLSDITKITVSADSNTFVGKATFTANAFVALAADFDTVGKIATMINNYAARGFHCDVTNPKTKGLHSDRVDKAAAVNALSPAKAHPRADLWAFEQALLASNLVTTALVTGYKKPLKEWNVADSSEEGLFMGGTATGPADDDWVDALAVLALHDVQVVVAIPEDGGDPPTQASQLIDHCVDSAQFGFERNAYIGADVGKTIVELSAMINLLNSRHLSVCGQEIQIETAVKGKQWAGPEFQAVQLAGIQCGKVAGESMTNKTPAVFGVRQKWTLVRDDDTLIAAGLCAYTQDGSKFKTTRVLTTWTEDDNPAESEVFANESVNVSIRRVRSKFKGKIGASTGGLPASLLVGQLQTELESQVQDGDIKAFADPAVEDLGDAVSFKYRLAPDESLNFILVSPTVSRISSSAG